MSDLRVRTLGRHAGSARWLIGGLVLLGVLAADACGGKTPTQPPPPPDGPFTACPADVQIESFSGKPIPVTYALPGASGGTPPLTVACTPESGAEFAVGEHPITCTVTDAASKTASCTFRIIVTTPPRIELTRFTAFGDSLTYGITSDAVTTLQDMLVLQRATLAPPPPEAYPAQLRRMLRSRYKLQATSVNVYNEGLPGECVNEIDCSSNGIARLPSAIAAHPTEVLLLMEGTNDLLNIAEGADRAIDGLRRMVRDAKGRGVEVFLATIPPQRAGGAHVPPRDAVAKRIPPFNDRVRTLAARENVPLVDVYAAMKDKLYLIGVDDLHPTPEGYQVMAQTFFDVIREQLEVKPPSQQP
jgi:lysophospholipase L1-like esterase